MITETSVKNLIESHIEGTDIFLVEVLVKPGNSIRVHVDRPGGISIDECVGISRYLNGELDRDVEDYSLEVSSPGLGSPFRVKQQYEKNVGREIEVSLEDGNKLKGKLIQVSEQGIKLDTKGTEREVNFEVITKAKAVISFN